MGSELKMDYRKKLSLSFLPLLLIISFLIYKEKKAEPIINPVRKVASVPKKKIIPHFQQATLSRSLKISRNKPLVLLYKNRIPQSVKENFEPNPAVRITEGHTYLNDVAAIAIKDYNPSMGKLIHQDKQFAYFSASIGHKYVPVAMSNFSNTLAPISAILHLRNATPEMRQKLLNDGFKESYYHASVKFLSIKSDSQSVLGTYNKLNNLGYQVEMEVLKPGHQSN